MNALDLLRRCRGPRSPAPRRAGLLVPRAGGPDPLDRPYRRATSIPPADPRELPRWNRLPWWRKAAVCCAQPTVFYGLMFAAMGALFLVGALVLDPRMAPIGLLLIAVALVMVVAYFILAYRAFGGRPKGRRRR